MKGAEMAAAMRRVAQVVEKFDQIPLPKRDAFLDPDLQIGAAAIVMYLRDLFTVSSKEAFTRDEIMVILNMVQNDRDIFSADLVTLFEAD